MKGIIVRQYGTPEQLEVTQLTVQTVQPNEVKIRVYAAGVNPSDVYTVTGTYAIKPALPFTPGRDGAGIIEEVGEQVTSWKAGDRVFIAAMPDGVSTGTIAEYVVCEEWFVFPLPAHISFEQGAALGVPAFTAYRAIVDRAQVKAGQVVFIHGASGAVGLQAVQMAKALGATVIGTASRETGKQLVREAGADVVLDHLTADNQQAVLDATNGKGPDVIIEFLANENLELDLQVVAKRGVIVVIGNRGELTINPRLMMQKECDVRGMILFNVTQPEHKALATGIVNLMNNNELTPVVGKSYMLEDATKAFEAVNEGLHNGKVIIAMK